jgi:hypothetical protein
LGINFSTAISIAYKISNSLNGFNKKLNGCVSLALSKFACQNWIKKKGFDLFGTIMVSAKVIPSGFPSKKISITTISILISLLKQG